MEPTDSYVIFPRKIASDFRNGRISKPELIIYYWLRQNGDPYGVARVSLPELREFYPSNVSENFINKILLSLKSKKYIYYERRAGRRGSFEVHLGDWILPNKGGIKTLERYFVPQVRPARPIETPKQSEPRPEEPPVNQSFLELKKHMAERFKLPPTTQ